MINRKRDNKSGIITAMKEVRKIKLTKAPNVLVNIPTIIEDRNSRFSKVKLSSPAKIKSINFSIFDITY